MEKRKAIAVHHTDVVDTTWDGPANETKLKLDADEQYYKKMYAWQDTDKDPKTKSAYKFPHHMVDADGNIGPANVKACISGIAVLNGARGGVDIPQSDVKGVYAHLSAHLKDADIEPPELKSNKEMEHRSYVSHLSLRSEGTERKIVGHSAVFDKLSVPLMGFREKIQPGAFSKTIKEDDVRALWNHNPDYVLGRTKAGTLKLKEDEVGLFVEVIPPDTQWARDVMKTIERGDVDQMSFGFKVVNERWEKKDGEDIRILTEVKLFDVSPVTFPAYPDTDVAVRTALSEIGIDFDKLCTAIRCKDTSYIRDVIEALSRWTQPAQEGTVPKRIEMLKRKLQLKEKEV